ncbi:MAG: thioredoxin family protein [Planctomycetes bacterium]|nr:thioredoxin family protein [Planctomycetota bacterium]
MAETPSSMVPIGTPMPTFSLADANGKLWKLNQDKRGYLVFFICNHCPYVIHIAKTLNMVKKLCDAQEIEMVCINSNDTIAYPADSSENMIKTAEEYGWCFPYLLDESQKVASAFCATCTPDIFLYDQNQRLYYRGQLDDSRPNSGASDGSDLLAAMDSLESGKKPPDGQKPSIGCNIKWKS